MEAAALQRGQLEALRDVIERGLSDILPDPGDPPHRLHAAMRYAVLSPGKRIRPLLALLSAGHLGCPPGAALPGACALELVHAASLVLDDLPCMDDSDARRGQPTVHVRYGEDVAVLTGVALLNEAFAVLGRANHIPEASRLAMVSLLARTVGTSGLIGGQDKDLRGSVEPSLGFVSQLHHEKTGVLFIASVEMGALAAGADATVLEALRAFGKELGLAFQALDDLADGEEDKASVNLLSVLGRDGLRDEAGRRLERAKAALADGAPQLVPLASYVDLLLRPAAA
ncbi:polyprenyl synthetase family protein [Phenylobacterium deserti]|uniref:Polyprenyl synthetase family protein n=1 Tax=Phenylobacterium deserti TaxID=1914756 RepID=A0A328ACV7_9CAUL|nr:polyprenyl synthetase family protein [Phenylobacterium deserti]RAK52499.1 polyprenyl synthetase family protein [Phenylobacterium deserti]